MGNIVGKQFRVVASKNVTDSLADSIKEGNQAKFYLAQEGVAEGKALDEVTSPDEFSDRNVLIINGNKIQGVSQNDINKLNAITDATKIFKYKGSVLTGDELKAKVPPEAEVGDVWNVEQECEINGVKYPAHTNFVCSSIKTLPATSTWDSLGGTMRIGTTAAAFKVNSEKLTYHNINDSTIPINQFSLVVSTANGLHIGTSNNLEINLNEPDLIFSDLVGERYFKKLTYARKQFSIIDRISIQVATPLTISTLGRIELGIGTGLANNDEELYISLANNKIYPIINNKYAENSGLSYNQYGELTVAIGKPGSNSGDCIDGALVLGTGPNSDTHGGLCISSRVMVDFINTNMNIRNYISSLIDAKLKAQ